MKIDKESRALTEVWEWKDDAYREVEGDCIEIAIEKRLNKSIKTAKRLGFTLTSTATRFRKAS